MSALPEPTGHDPGGPLVVTGPGSVVVGTDAILAAADRIRVLEAALLDDRRRVDAAAEIPGGAPVDGLARAIDGLRTRCGDYREALVRAALAYADAERANSAAQHQLAAAFASLFGPVAFGAFVTLLLAAPIPLLTGALTGYHVLSDRGVQAMIQRWIRENPELITSPEFARFVSLVATSVDDAVPGPFGPHGGAEASALTLLTVAGLVGLLRDGPVTVDRVSTTTGGAAPIGVRERLDRIPEGDQVRIERYDAPGLPPRFVVYIGPTETFSPLRSDEPFDLTGDVAGVAGLSPGSLRAVEQAMADAGIRPGDEVQLVGFSQGGVLTAALTASGDWNVVGIETHGAPTGTIPVPAGTAGMSIRHTDDFVTALGGPQQDTGVMQIEREAFAGDEPIPTDLVVPAHQRVAYERTADAIDAAESSAVREQIATMDAFSGDYLAAGGEVTVTTYHATRVDGLTRDP